MVVCIATDYVAIGSDNPDIGSHNSVARYVSRRAIYGQSGSRIVSYRRYAYRARTCCRTHSWLLIAAKRPPIIIDLPLFHKAFDCLCIPEDPCSIPCEYQAPICLFSAAFRPLFAFLYWNPIRRFVSSHVPTYVSVSESDTRIRIGATLRLTLTRVEHGSQMLAHPVCRAFN